MLFRIHNVHALALPLSEADECGTGEDVALGAPVEYIQLKGTTYDKPAVCKYTGNKYYSDDWMHHAGGH